MSPASVAPEHGGACNVTLTCGATSLAFERAYFGFNGTPATSLHVELHRGGDEGCPHAASATPLQTLILSDVPLPAQGDEASATKGVTASFVDFAQAFTSSVAPLVATDVELSRMVVTTSSSPPRVSFDLALTFVNGLVGRGQLWATHCPSLDG